MYAQRIIPCLDIKDGRTVKGINFVNLVDAGDPVELAKEYGGENSPAFINGALGKIVNNDGSSKN